MNTSGSDIPSTSLHFLLSPFLPCSHAHPTPCTAVNFLKKVRQVQRLPSLTVHLSYRQTLYTHALGIIIRWLAVDFQKGRLRIITLQVIRVSLVSYSYILGTFWTEAIPAFLPFQLEFLYPK